MKPRAALFLLLALVGCEQKSTVAPPPLTSGPVALLVPAQGRYTGAYVEFGDREDEVTLEKIEGFEQLAGKSLAIVASSSYWGENSFPAANVRLVFAHGSVPLIFWSPWDRPYLEQPEVPPFPGPDRFNLTNIVAGKWDAYIDRWAEGARAFGQPMLVSFGNEMNGAWFPWSGKFSGGGTVIPGSQPPRYAGPEMFKAAYRHVVDRVRARGANNVLWVFHAMNAVAPAEEWNRIAHYYPGADYVDWLGLSVYGQQFGDEDWSPFEPLLTYHYEDDEHVSYDGPYEQLCALDPQKPIMLAEWGCGEFRPQSSKANPSKSGGDKAQWLAEGFRIMQKLPRLKAAIYWHERWENAPLPPRTTPYYSNLHINSTPESLAAYRHGLADPAWLGAPLYRPRQPSPALPGNRPATAPRIFP